MREELESLWERLAAHEQREHAEVQQHGARDAECRQAVAHLKARHAEELMSLRPRHAESTERIKAQHQADVNALHQLHAEEALVLREALKQAAGERDLLREDLDEASDAFAAWQREGARLQEQYSDARQEVLDLSLEVRDMLWRAPPPAPLDELLELAEDEDPYMELELQDLCQRCHSLERQCATLEKLHDQAVDPTAIFAERRRRRALQRRMDEKKGTRAGRLGERHCQRAGGDESLDSSELPFVLGPECDAEVGLSPVRAPLGPRFASPRTPPRLRSTP